MNPKRLQSFRNKPVIAVTTGDPAGIGPEIVARLFSQFQPRRSTAVLVGAPLAYGPWIDRCGLDFPVITSLKRVEGVTGSPIVMLDTGVGETFSVGENSGGGGRHAGRAIELACELVNIYSVQGIVTAPISKKSLNLANFPFTGHTEMLARYLNAPHCQMMMVHENLRVVPLTRHVPLSDVSANITGKTIQTCVRETVRALAEDFGIEAPRIAVSGLNPHAGDDGLIGSEEGDTIGPELAQLQNEGIDVTGPLAGDALFPRAYKDCVLGRERREKQGGREGNFDAYIAMYHDQGLIPFKMISQRRGINVTVGLPVVRTSVDHGVAYDIAGRGVAETDSLYAAYMLAEQMCINRNKQQ